MIVSNRAQPNRANTLGGMRVLTVSSTVNWTGSPLHQPTEPLCSQNLVNVDSAPAARESNRGRASLERRARAAIASCGSAYTGSVSPRHSGRCVRRRRSPAFRSVRLVGVRCRRVQSHTVRPIGFPSHTPVGPFEQAVFTNPFGAGVQSYLSCGS